MILPEEGSGNDLGPPGTTKKEALSSTFTSFLQSRLKTNVCKSILTHLFTQKSNLSSSGMKRSTVLARLEQSRAIKIALHVRACARACAYGTKESNSCGRCV